ncbi:MAG TPA: dTMP kinase [Gemmatimonadaceae bacterium]|nr:dTMP kinase [Gemmatimonadaceae bacterium]
MRAPGKVVVFEGGEGVGKTTQIGRLSKSMFAREIPHLLAREPGGTPLGGEIRHILLDPAREDMVPRAEALLFMASRAQLVESQIRPAVAQGDFVLLDRFFLSTYAYQVAGRGLPEDEIRAANRFATGGLVPDLTLLLELPDSEGIARAEGRNGELDRIERSSDGFHDRVAAAFSRFSDPDVQRAYPECGPIVRVDARGAEAEVASRILETLASKWPETFGPLLRSH